MPIFSPVAQALLRRTGIGRSLADVCSEQFTVSDGATVERRPAVYLENELERITGLAPSRSLALELSRLRPGPMHLPPWEAYVLKNAFCIDGNIYKSLAKHAVAGSTRALIASASKVVLSGVLVSDRQSHLYFGHWLTEELPATFVARRYGRPLTTHYGRQPYSHEAGYLQLNDIEAPAELPVRCVLPSLTVLASRGMNQGHLSAFEEFRAALVRKGWQRRNRCIFLRRGGGSPRSLINEAEVIAFLARKGFAIVTPEELSAEELARECFDARLVIGVEGSHLAHAVVQMNKDAALLVIQPPGRFNNPFKDLCDATQKNYGFVVAEQTQHGFSQPIDRLWKALNILSDTCDTR